MNIKHIHPALPILFVFCFVYFFNLSNSFAVTTNLTLEIAPLPECSDTLDNDGDTFIDFPLDPDCIDANDNMEENESNPGGGGNNNTPTPITIITLPPTPTPTPIPPDTSGIQGIIDDIINNIAQIITNITGGDNSNNSPDYPFDANYTDGLDDHDLDYIFEEVSDDLTNGGNQNSSGDEDNKPINDLFVVEISLLLVTGLIGLLIVGIRKGWISDSIRWFILLFGRRRKKIEEDEEE